MTTRRRPSTSCSVSNDNDIAVGFYTDAQGNNHGYTYNIGRQTRSAG